MPTRIKPADKPVRLPVFALDDKKVWTYRYACELVVTNLTGGIPSDPKVAEGWLRTKLQAPDSAILNAVADLAAERGVSVEDAIEEYVTQPNVNGFKRVDGALVIEGRNVKAAIKEAFSVAAQGGHVAGGANYGALSKKKGLQSFVAEHVVVADRYIPLLREDDSPYTEPTGVQQRFVHTHRGSSIAYEEFCDPAVLQFEVWSDWNFGKEWPKVWSVGQRQGIGATRSQGCGTYFVSRWDEL